MRDSKKGNLPILLLCAVLYAVCFFLQGRAPLSVRGMIAQAQVVISVVMVLLCRKRGLITAACLGVAQAAYLLVAQVAIKAEMSAMTGAVVTITTISMMWLIYTYVSGNEKMTRELTESYQQAIDKNRIIEEQGESLKFMAYYDSLTNMPNRRLFLEKLEEHIKKDGDCTVIYADLDDFRKINEKYGHDVGDELLAHYAKEIEKICKDEVYAARIGGDEFGLMLRSVRPDEVVYAFVDKIRGAINAPVELRGKVFTVASSFGAASFPMHAMTADELFRCAETAMFTSKSLGKNQLCFYVRKAEDTK